VGLSALLLRLAILPWHPATLPFVPDSFSFLLAANTVAHDRLSSPTPAMWIYFESIHLDMFPTYGSMYFPVQGLLLAVGKVLLGHPWFGVLLAGALMCAAICWMLQPWLPPTWALLGAILAILRLALFSYWINTHYASGALAALGGALVLGALPRLTRTPVWLGNSGIKIVNSSCTYLRLTHHRIVISDIRA
jgi:predicted membrane protein